MCILLVTALATWLYIRLPPSAALPETVMSEAPAVSPKHRDYVGAQACMYCHREAFAAWTGSQHALAMQEANAKTVLGDFNDAKFNYHAVESKFFKRDGKFFVRTDGPDGRLADYPIKYTFGVTPLQQYLIEFPGGRYQALSIAWDSRSPAEGGQRWFHLYPNENVDHDDQLHWTGRYQNWNLQCAECHSTNLKKGYDAASDTYQTTFSALNVSCEACHGPASQHLAWAKSARPPYPDGSDQGLTVRLKSRWHEAWVFPDPAAKFARRDRPASDAMMNTCWACHARRSTLVEGAVPGLPLEDTHIPALLTQPTYYADGQQRDEDYTWGSFRQSKMYRKGVTCMDCHEPHALKLRAEGNALCIRCHKAADFDATEHHFHKLGSKGAECMNCHAPARNYMVIDGRHDHSFRLPRPDLSLSLGSPNACTQCHQDRKPEWAVSALDKWYGNAWRERPHYGTVLQAGVTQGAKALPGLLELARDTGMPAVVRASAATLAAPLMRREFLPAAQALLQDSDPSVRIAALGLWEAFSPAERTAAVAPLLSDPVLGVRLEAGRIVADIPETQFKVDERDALHTVLEKYIAVLHQDTDWPVGNVNLGNLARQQGKIDAAISWYKRALALDPRFAGAYVNLADAYRQQNREAEGEALLRQGLALLPRAAGLHHALGLLLVRKGDALRARQALATAAELAPENARYTYVYAVALHSAGKQRQALAVLQAADRRHPYDPDILSALIAMQREAGNAEGALFYARKAAEILPDDSSIQRLMEALKAEK
ncbi:MAG: tetratricopeptide repeat protein [Gammaproteobacteria bacterium]